MKPLMVIPARGSRRRRSGLLRFVSGVLRLLKYAFFALVAYVAFFAASAWRHDYPLATGPVQERAWRGAYHVHSTLSDGRATPEEIAADARAAGFQFVVLSDHNQETLAPPRFVDGVLLISAVELSTDAGHVIALGTSRGLTRAEREGDVMAHIASLGGFAFLAHPEQKKRPWTDWEAAKRATGLELYSADSMFRTAQRRPLTVFGPAAAGWLGNSRHGLLTVVTDQPEVTARLLDLNATRPFVAMCAHDAHGLPTYLSEFETLGIYVRPPSANAPLPSDPAAAASAVISALVGGEAWCGFHAIAPADDFALSGVGEGRVAHVGDTVTVRLPASLPPEVAIRVSGPGTLLEDGRSIRLDGEGAVQIEVWARVPGMYFQDGWKPWLVPSPVRVSKKPSPPAAPPELLQPTEMPTGSPTPTANEAPPQADGGITSVTLWERDSG